MRKDSFDGKMRWLASDFDGIDRRFDAGGAPELFESAGASDRLGPLTRDLVESGDWFVELSEDGRVKRAIRRRDAESIPWLDPEEMDEEEKQARACEEEDAMNYREEQEATVPPAKWDLVFWTEIRSTPEGEWIEVEKSSAVFPRLRDKRLRGYARNLERAIARGMIGRALYRALNEGPGAEIPIASKARLWELHKISRFLREREKGKKQQS